MNQNGKKELKKYDKVWEICLKYEDYKSYKHSDFSFLCK